MPSNRRPCPPSDSSPKVKRAKIIMEAVGATGESVGTNQTNIAGESGGAGDATDVVMEQGNEEDTPLEELEGEPIPDSSSTEPGTSLQSPVEPQELPPIKYEYLDHTADVQIHAWGDTLAEAFEQCAMGMFAYITDMERIDNFGSERIEATGHDMLSLLYGFLDEWLFVFNADPYFVARKISITSFDRENFKISAIGYGETFDLSKHTQGTEVKAITYSNMQFHEKDGYAEVFVIIDI